MSESLVAWSISRNQFKPVWAETVENHPARKLELLSPHNRGHQVDIWQIIGNAIFLKDLYLFQFFFKR